MISKEEVLKLAELARLKIGDGEVEGLQKDISSILEYVGQVSAVQPQGETFLSDSKDSPFGLHTVMREDLPRLASGKAGVPTPVLGEREALLNAFPTREGDFNVVRKIIQKDE
ncbi:aspartyl/glutamyl-tRNA amidotransferase subunit C [Candidatus Kaiserbacteria bacterium]|nr:aspartyl/glutamyl-tRNA amidotransferase subunit C [Candidatus Kaiserbacteria bacterium]